MWYTMNSSPAGREREHSIVSEKKRHSILGIISIAVVVLIVLLLIYARVGLPDGTAGLGPALLIFVLMVWLSMGSVGIAIVGLC